MLRRDAMTAAGKVSSLPMSSKELDRNPDGVIVIKNNGRKTTIE